MNDSDLLQSARFGSRAFYFSLRVVVRFIFLLIARVHIEGLENLPDEGPYMLASNHINWSDIPMIAAPIPRQVIFMAKSELFKSSFSEMFIKALGSFPVRRGESDRQALKMAEVCLEQGNVLAIFPEGHRSDDHRLKEGKSGTAVIAYHANVQVIPVAIWGTEKLFTSFHFWPLRQDIHIRYGKPLTFTKDTRLTKENVNDGITRIMGSIANLLPEDYK